MLDPTVLSSLRRIAEESLTHACTVQRWNAAFNRWDTVVSCGCRLVPKRSVTRDAGGTLMGITLWNAVLPTSVDVRVNDRLAIASSGTYVVTGTDKGRTDAVVIVAQCNVV